MLLPVKPWPVEVKASAFRNLPVSGIVVPALEVVQLRFGVVDITPVAEGVVGAQGGCQGAGDGFAPGVIGVGNHWASRSVQDGRHIPLQVGGVVVGGAVVGRGMPLAS